MGDSENFLGNYENYNTLAKRKTAIDYLADRGVNSCYIMTHNIGGDDKDVWPWLGRTQEEAKLSGGSNSRFDVAKLEQWRELFEYMQTGDPGSRSGLKHAAEHNQLTIDWINLCQKRGKRVLVANFDEGRPEHDRRAWWSAYLGGGVWEAHVGKEFDQPMSAWKMTWKELGGTRAFMKTLPFWKMQPQNDLVIEGLAFCLAQPGEAYAFYLPKGGRIQVELKAGADYNVAWWNPSNGLDGSFSRKSTCQGGRQRFEAPSEGDWALHIVKRD